MRKLIVLAGLVVIAGCARQAPDCGALEVRDAWVRAMPAGAGMTAGYMRVINPGEATVVVTGAQSAAFGKVTMHRTVINNGQVHMEPIDAISVPPDEAVVFKPGGRHLMLMQPQKSGLADDQVTMRLACGADHLRFTSDIRETAPHTGMGHQRGHDSGHRMGP